MRAAALVPWLATALLAQAPGAPHIGYAYPAGLQQGAVGQVTVGGKALQGATAAEFSGRGISAEILDYTRPMTNMERNAARELVAQLLQKRQQQKLTPEEDAKVRELRQKLANNPRQQPNPQIAETVTLRLTIAADAPAGWQELRLLTASGLSNPLRFAIGDCREHAESEPNDTAAEDGVGLPLPMVLNGQILPGDVDRFRFRARKGMQLVATVEARALMPYLADAVPGWFQATLALYDQGGGEVAYDDDNRFAPDPLLAFAVPQDGDYVLEIKDAVYRGREDFVYRIHLGEAGAADDTRSDAAPFAAFDLPEAREREPNDEQAQRLLLPTCMRGCIERPGDVDVFDFAGKAGDRISAEVLARRLDSPLDSLLRLCDARGRELARNDDHVDAAAGLVTHQADSWLAFTLPADGVYRILVADTQQKGSAGHVYRLRVGPPRPDFALRVVPSAINVRAGGTAVFTVHALRQDGFAGDIALALVDPLPGFALSGAWVPGKLDQIAVTLTAPAQAPASPVRLQLEGSAALGGKVRHRLAVPAEDMMQAFAWRHLVPAEEWLCAVTRGEKAAGMALAARAAGPVRLPRGGSIEIPIASAGRRPLPDGIEFALNDAPDGITVGGVAAGSNGPVLTLRADAKKVAAGVQGNLIVDVFLRRSVQPRDQKQKPRQQRNQLGTLPAIAFVVVDR